MPFAIRFIRLLATGRSAGRGVTLWADHSSPAVRGEDGHPRSRRTTSLPVRIRAGHVWVHQQPAIVTGRMAPRVAALPGKFIDPTPAGAGPRRPAGAAARGGAAGPKGRRRVPV